MSIKTIVLATAAFGFATCSMLAMQNLENLNTQQPYTHVFLCKTLSLSGDSIIRYMGPAGSIGSFTLLLPQQIQKQIRFGSRFAIEKALAEKNFRSCRFSSGREAIICNTTDERACSFAEELDVFRTKECLAGRQFDYDVYFTSKK